MGELKTGAIWARVSTDSQSETSLPSQVARCKEKLEQAGYKVLHAFQTTWTSTELDNCPKFNELRSLIKNKEIDALCVYDRDRLQADGVDRLVFLSECKEAGIELLFCNGAALLESEEGQIVELALAIGKRRQVMRARQGSKDGLHDRAIRKGLPVTYHKIYGYSWLKPSETQVRPKLVPNSDYPTVKFIFDLLLKGKGYDRIIAELKRQGIASPSGALEWNKTGISTIVHNPVYAGRYYVLKKEAVQPVKRRGETRGNSSNKLIPLDDSRWIKTIEVADSPITWEQRGQIHNQLIQHQSLSSRRANRDYLLRGMVYCSEHFGKNGLPRRYHGRPKRETYYYACPVGGCEHAYLPGPELEEDIKNIISIRLLHPGRVSAIFKSKETQEITSASLHAQLDTLEKQNGQAISIEARLEDRFLCGDVIPEVYQRLKLKYKFERDGRKTREQELLTKLAQVNKTIEVEKSLDSIRKKYRSKLSKLSDDKWRELFMTLDLKITYGDFTCEVPQVEDLPPEAQKAFLSLCKAEGIKPGDTVHYPYRVELGIPIETKAKEISSIVSVSPGDDVHYTQYPIVLYPSLNDESISTPSSPSSLSNLSSSLAGKPT